MRSAASCGQPLQVSDVPRGARMMRVAVAMTDADGKLDTKKLRERCQFEKRNIFYLTRMPHAVSTPRDAINSVIATMSGAGTRSASRIGTRDRTHACTFLSSGEVSSGASRSIAWHAHKNSIAI